jgi:uncharacterized protein
VSPLAEIPFLLGAGVLAGVASSAGAIGSLISYPALLLAGLPPVVANATGTVAVTGVAVVAPLRSRAELRTTRVRLARAAVATLVGGGIGGALLLLTPGGVFLWIVPFLVGLASVLLIAQPHVVRRHGLRPHLVPGGLLAVAVYEGYFGAGAGVLSLALLLLSVADPLPTANAVKNLTLGVADLAAGVLFVAFGSVSWTAAVPLGIGIGAGAAIGPVIARRARPDVLRLSVGTLGVGLAVVLLVEAAR